ncbi:MAG: biotin/lipoyl-containing protein, partial [Nitrospirota bacterium]|nr:biotin/lipoyl-containing protein [Nitrospirota bacterium]
MPQMGESVVEGTILKWLIQEGQRVEKDQSLVEISTDKVDTEIPSPVAGLVTKILRHADETVPVGTVIVLIEEGAEGVKAPQAPEIPPAGLPAKERHEEIAEQRAGLEKRYSPLVRRLAKEYGVDLERVRGTGTGGRITKEDLLGYIEETQKTTLPARAKIPETKEAEGIKEEIIPVSAKRKIIAEHRVHHQPHGRHRPQGAGRPDRRQRAVRG